MNKQCEQCGTVFKVKPSHYDTKRFCSKSCHNESMRRYLVKTCKRCNNEFKGRPSAIKNQIYCSRECLGLAKRESISYNDIYELYINKRMTTREAGKALGVSKRKILDTLRYYKIPVRSNAVQLKGDGYKMPSRSRLSKLYHDEFKTLGEIAEIFEVDTSTVANWMNEHGLETRSSGGTKRGRDFIMPTKSELESMYTDKKMSMREIGRAINGSKTIVRRLIKKYKIKPRPPIYNGRDFIECKDGHKVMSSLERIVDDFLFDNGIEHDYDKRLPKPYGRFKTDFYCIDSGVYIEVWGITNNKEYNKRRKRKEKIYNDLGIDLISIEAHDFKDDTVFEKLNRLIPR